MGKSKGRGRGLGVGSTGSADALHQAGPCGCEPWLGLGGSAALAALGYSGHSGAGLLRLVAAGSTDRPRNRTLLLPLCPGPLPALCPGPTHLDTCPRPHRLTPTTCWTQQFPLEATSSLGLAGSMARRHWGTTHRQSLLVERSMPGRVAARQLGRRRSGGQEGGENGGM